MRGNPAATPKKCNRKGAIRSKFCRPDSGGQRSGGGQVQRLLLDDTSVARPAYLTVGKRLRNRPDGAGWRSVSCPRQQPRRVPASGATAALARSLLVSRLEANARACPRRRLASLVWPTQCAGRASGSCPSAQELRHPDWSGETLRGYAGAFLFRQSRDNATNGEVWPRMIAPPQWHRWRLSAHSAAPAATL
jgi:hypothetical protein